MDVHLPPAYNGCRCDCHIEIGATIHHAAACCYPSSQRARVEPDFYEMGELIRLLGGFAGYGDANPPDRAMAVVLRKRAEQVIDLINMWPSG